MGSPNVYMSVLVCLVFHISYISSYPYAFDTIHGLGPKFDGVGAISGGGATSKLLVNYPEPQRNQVLDYLFKPGFGASLQILKVEIGGDSQSSEGTESSHMHYPWDENYQRGYEWWIMKEAKQRNPDIVLCGLPWGFPGWLSGGAWWPYKYPNVTANYIVKWIKGAKTYHNLTIDYVGIWNEKPYDPVYIQTLKWNLVNSGFSHVKIIAADAIGSNAWDIAEDMQSDPQLMKVVDVVGGHYTGTWTSPQAKALNKPLWASEDFSNTADDFGAACMARLLNQNFVNGQMTGFIAWNMLTAYYDNLPYKRRSLMVAQQPWSGHYEVTGPVWTTAHTTQFTSIGWSYLKVGYGSGFLKKGGSYVSLVSPDGKDFTIVIETTDGKNKGVCLNIPMYPYTVSAQNVTLNLKGQLGNLKQLNVWKSKIDYKTGKSVYLQKAGKVKLVNGALSLNIDVDEVITLTTLGNGQKGTHGLIPKAAPFPANYTDDFESYDIGKEANNFAQQVGVFEVVQTNVVQHGKVLRQMMLQVPIHWCPFAQTSPLTVIGNYQWADVIVSADVRVPAVNGSTGVLLGARVDQGGCTTFIAQGIFMVLDMEMDLVELALDLERTIRITKVNFVLDEDKWYKAVLQVKGNTVLGTVNGQTVFKEVLKKAPPKGFTALGTTHFGLADFDNFRRQQIG